MEKSKKVDLLITAEDAITRIGEHSIRGAYEFWEQRLTGKARLGKHNIELNKVSLLKKRPLFDYEKSFESVGFYKPGHLKVEEVEGKNMHIVSTITLDFNDSEGKGNRLTLSNLTLEKQELFDFLPKEVVQLSLSSIGKRAEIGGESQIEVRWVQEIAKSTYMPLDLEDSELARERLLVGREMLQLISSL